MLNRFTNNHQIPACAWMTSCAEMTVLQQQKEILYELCNVIYLHVAML